MSKLHDGLYDALLNKEIQDLIAALPSHRKADTETLTGSDAIEYVVREISDHIRTRFRAIKDASADEILAEASRLFESIFATSEENFAPRVLTEVRPSVRESSIKPVVPLSQSALITNDQRLNYHALLRSEILSADRIDWICPFIGNQGLNLIIDLLKNQGNKLRVISTTYLGGTHRNAIDRLIEVGATVKIAYERADQKTALHAKAWLFHRDSGYSTATIGSSNLSPKALVDGIEWNVRLSTIDAPVVFDELVTTFGRLWDDQRFEEFDPGRDGERLTRALSLQRGVETPTSFFVDINPYPHQQEALDALKYARLEGKQRNLIVAATGTGKTLISAFDYRNLCRSWGKRPRLLFVAHRKDILEQARSAFRMVLRDSEFGELHVGDDKATAWEHVFGSVQALHDNRLLTIDPQHFDVLIIDEFHHAEAPTYRRILEHLFPREVIGLTATPERADASSEVIDSFGEFTYELRLWQALDAGLIAPFHYFGIDDGTDLSEIAFEAGRYRASALEDYYSSHRTRRTQVVLRELCEKVGDLDGMRAVAFCVSTKHADEMALAFREFNINAESLHSAMDADERSTIMAQFRDGTLNLVCVVDLLNEGVDVPEIDVVLFLRPTESPVLFTQQLGRGLRLHENKAALTVLDFVGQQNRKFRMDLRFRAMTGLTRAQLKQSIESEFPSLPAGCHIRLDRVTRERALRNLNEAIPLRRADLLRELNSMLRSGKTPTVGEFLSETGLEPVDFYSGRRSLFDLLTEAKPGSVSAEDNQYRITSISHVDDRIRSQEYLAALNGSKENSFGRMVAFPLSGTIEPARIPNAIREEAKQLLEYLSGRLPIGRPIASDLPFVLHASYTRDEIVAPFRPNPVSMRQGTFFVEDLAIDIHLVTLRKSERAFSPTTMYKDKVISRTHLQWESQSTTAQATATGRRLVASGSRHIFFVREHKDDPFTCLGFADAHSAEGDKPILVQWQLREPISEALFPRFKAAS